MAVKTTSVEAVYLGRAGRRGGRGGGATEHMSGGVYTSTLRPPPYPAVGGSRGASPRQLVYGERAAPKGYRLLYGGRGQEERTFGRQKSFNPIT